jgi:hypothetical protein
VQAPSAVRQPVAISFSPAKFHSETLPARRIAAAPMPPMSASVSFRQPPFVTAS